MVELGNAFKVEFKNSQEGLDALVALAVSTHKSASFILADEMMSDPIGWLRVTLRPNEYLEGGRFGYVLRAVLLPRPENVLRINPIDYDNEFAVGNATAGFYALTWQNQPMYSSLEAFERGNGLVVFSSHVCQKWYSAQEKRWATEAEVKEKAGQAITAFAKALETTVNSAYKCAGKPSSQRTLVLAAYNG